MGVTLVLIDLLLPTFPWFPPGATEKDNSSGVGVLIPQGIFV